MKLDIDQQAIRSRAYQLWNERGRPTGSAERDWYDAEQELLSATGEPLHQALPGNPDQNSGPSAAAESAPKAASKPAATKSNARIKKGKDNKPKLRDPSEQPGGVSATRLLAKLAANSRN